MKREWMFDKGAGDVFKGMFHGRPKYDEHIVHDVEGDIIAYVRDEPSARLIAAAPDLLTAVEDYLAPHPSGSHPGGGGDQGAGARLERLRAAIRKARGQ